MNGSFTSSESRYLTPDERQHYLEIGLCAPVDATDLERILDKGGWHNRIEELEGELELLKDEHYETTEDLQELQGKVKRCLEYMVKAENHSISYIIAQVCDLLT